MAVVRGGAGSVVLARPVRGVRVGAFPSAALVWIEGRLASLLDGNVAPSILASINDIERGALVARHALAEIGLPLGDVDDWPLDRPLSSRPLPELGTVLRRVDLAVDVAFDDPSVGQAFLRALGSVTVARRALTPWIQPDGTNAVYLRTPQGVTKVRAYDRGFKSGGERGQLIRLEAPLRFKGASRPSPAEFMATTPPKARWGAALAGWAPAAAGLMVCSPPMAEALILARCRSGELSARRAERLLGTLRLHQLYPDRVPDWVWSSSQRGARRRELAELGLVVTDAHGPSRTACDVGGVLQLAARAWDEPARFLEVAA